MNRKMIFSVLQKLLVAEGILMFLPMAVSLIYGEASWTSFLIVSAILLVIGLIPAKVKAEEQAIYTKEGLMIVGLVWVLWSAFGALPFVISGAIPNYIDAFFETVSGFTTTGSTILAEIESLPKGILFWRSFTHWIGGMGVLVFVLAIVPLANTRSMYIMKAEVPGPVSGKLVSSTSETAKILYEIYIGMTVLLIGLLMAGGMSLYDACIHAFGTAGTGGFSVKNASIAAYNSAYIDVVITLFMFLFGVNFNLFYFILLRKFKSALKNEELWVYTCIAVGASVLIGINICGQYSNFLEALRYSGFTVASVMSTTGYVTADFCQWPFFSQNLLVILMIFGACAGSTGGGIKISRLIIIYKSLKRELHKVAHPREVSSIRMDEKRVEEETVSGVHIYMLIYFVIIVLSCFLVSLEGKDIVTTFTSVMTTLNNVGPGMGSIIGATGNFSTMSAFSKIVLSFDMLLGRLEIFPILMILSPSLWKRKNL